MTRAVTRITPIDGGWAVETPFGTSPLTFLSGAKAEAKAVELAKLAAGRGVRTEVHIQDRSFELVAILSFEPDGAVAEVAGAAVAPRWTGNGPSRVSDNG